MKLSQFKFEIPLSLIAKKPTKNRDESRLMVVHKDSGKIEHKLFKDVVDYFETDDVITVNNTKIFPARIFGRKEKTGAEIEVFLLRELNKKRKLWDVIVDPARKIRVGNKLFFGPNDELAAEVIDNTTSRGRTIRFLYEGEHSEYDRLLHELGETPLPKVFGRHPTADDDERYQTVFAKYEGAVAASAAGLHFSKELIKKLEINGINFAEITLHTGLGTYRPIEVEDLRKHKMDAEYIHVDDYACQIVNAAIKNNKRICAVGNTSLRALESTTTSTNLLKPADTWTNLFMHPPYNMAIANSLITGFHLPKTSLLITVCAFAGYELIMQAYQEAIKEKYRFFTYGDAMLIV